MMNEQFRMFSDLDVFLFMKIVKHPYDSFINSGTNDVFESHLVMVSLLNPVMNLSVYTVRFIEVWRFIVNTLMRIDLPLHGLYAEMN